MKAVVMPSSCIWIQNLLCFRARMSDHVSWHAALLVPHPPRPNHCVNECLTRSNRAMLRHWCTVRDVAPEDYYEEEVAKLSDFAQIMQRMRRCAAAHHNKGISWS